MDTIMGISKNITGPLFKWFGSKWSSAPKYPKPIFKTIIEPFAGSAGYALRYAQHNIHIYDKNVNLNALWRWLIYEAEYKDVMSIPVRLPEGQDILELDLSYGQKLLLKHWQRTNNVGNCWTISPWGNKPGQWTENTRKRVASEIQYIKHWKFGEVDWRKTTGTYFIDPPYQYNYNYKLEIDDYDELAKNINSIPHPNQIIVCEAVCPKTKAIPEYLPFKFFANRITSRRKEHNNHHSKELIYHCVKRTINGELKTEIL